MSDSKAAGFEEKGFRDELNIYVMHNTNTRGQNSVKKSEFCPLVVEVKMEYNNDVSE